MNQNPETQFKKFLITIIVVSAVIVFAILRPDFFNDFRNTGGMRLSSDKPWQEKFAEEEVVDDVDIEFAYPENEFKKEDSNNPFTINKET